MSDEAKQATPKAELERQLMDCNVPKNEREWWAAAEIERLRTERLAFATESEERQAEIERLQSCLYAQEAVKPLYDEIKRLQELLRGIGANRYWEGRWRDEKAENERLLAAIRDAHALIENDLVIPWIMAHKLDAILGAAVQQVSRWCLHSNPSLCRFPDCECPSRSDKPS